MKGAAKRVAALEADLAAAKAEAASWKELYAAASRLIQPSITSIPFIYTPPVYVPPCQAPSPLPYYEIICTNGTAS